MKKLALLLLWAFTTTVNAYSQPFEELFNDKTLRVDYIFAGDATHQAIYLNHLSSQPHWAGRRVNMDKLLLKGDSQIEMRDSESGKLIYTTSFSTLYSEWLTTEEAETTPRAFENTILLPYPKKAVDITININNNRHQSIASMKHRVDPDDILIRANKTNEDAKYYYTHQGGDYKDCIDIAIISEGYTEEEIGKFFGDAKTATKAIFEHEPFASMKDRFNIIAIYVHSDKSGVSIPKDHDWKQTSFSSHFSTFYTDRYLTTSNINDVHNSLIGIDYEHVIILANTNEYGGGGIFNNITLTAAHNKWFKPVVVHEFGHAFGGLGDEYYYTEVDTTRYPSTIEPWEPNITTKVAFEKKWKERYSKGEAGLIEGGGYSGKYIYRAFDNCRMKTNTYKEFCSVCQDAIVKMINYYTKEE